MFVSHIFSMNSRWRLLAVLLAVVAMPLSASAQTTSDLFEKAVYADETAGNLDEAIELYGQVLAKAKVTSSLAAEAQYRLGLCFEKQDKPKEAREAFQAVVDNFPQEAKFVTLAKKHLPRALELLPVPWLDEQQLHMTIELLTGKEIGTQIFSIFAAKDNGQPVWRCSNRVFVNLNDSNSYSEVFCKKQSFAPLKSFWKHTLLGQAEATYTEGKVSIDILGRDRPVEQDFSVPGYDNEQCMQLFRRLPLEVGFHTEIPVIATLMGNVIPLELDVHKKETITTPVGKFECYRLELNIGQTIWISDDANRYVVRFEAGGVSANLTKVEHRPQDAQVEIADDQLSITLPKRWSFYEPESEKDERGVYLLDPGAITFAKLSVASREKMEEQADFLKEDEQLSPQLWIEAALKKRADMLKGFKVRGEGVVQMKREDQEATSVIFDFVQDKKPMTGYLVSKFGDQSVGFFKFVLSTDQFESQRGEFDQLVHSLRLK